MNDEIGTRSLTDPVREAISKWLDEVLPLTAVADQMDLDELIDITGVDDLYALALTMFDCLVQELRERGSEERARSRSWVCPKVGVTGFGRVGGARNSAMNIGSGAESA